MKKILFCFGSLAIIMFSSCLKENPTLNQTYKGFIPVDIGDGWTLSNPTSEQMDASELDDIYQDVYADKNAWMMKSLLVFRNGKLVAEGYLKDDGDRTRVDAIWSCTKQLNSIITGIAINRGFISNINDSIGKYFPEYLARYPDKMGISIKTLLTMNSGIAFDNGTQNDIFRQRETDSSLDYILGLKFNDPPGTKYTYKDSDPHLLSAIVQKATGKPMDEFGKEVLFDPLGITNYKWFRYVDGITLGSWGIVTTPRELAKVAQCVLDRGIYKDQQIIPASWLEEMLSVHVSNAYNELSFGYLWWIHPSKGIYFTWGHGGQHAFILPSKNLLVLITSFPQIDFDLFLPIEYTIGIVERIANTAK
jgi:CubicO group peptidase (beta-lactamase class C family)